MTDDDLGDNHVFLRGRLAENPITRTLPSGDELTVFRLTVDRPEGERGKVDSLECVTTRARPRNSLHKSHPGDTIEVTGRLRRRFWRGPGGVASRYAVDVVAARVAKRAPSDLDHATGASPDPKQASA